MGLSELERQFWQATIELSRRQRELTDLVAQAIDADPYEYWVLRRFHQEECPPQLGHTADGAWQFFFHGREFDVRHLEDGREVRVDFAPGGRLAFQSWAVGEFVRDTKPPWQVFPELKSHLINAGGYPVQERLAALTDALLERGYFALAEPRLSALKTKYTRVVSEYERMVEIPPDEMPQETTDLLLCDNLVLTHAGREGQET